MNIPYDANAVPAADVAATIPPGPLSTGGAWLDPIKQRLPNTAENAASPTGAKPGKFDPRRLRLSQGFEAGAVNKTGTVTAHKPDRHSWFMAHQDPDYHFQTMVLDIKAARETYLVEPDLREELALELSPKVIIPCITRQHDVFLWAVSLPDSSGRSNTWVDSAMEAVERAMHGWIRLVANMGAGGYDTYQPRVQLDPPVWPDLTVEEMLEKAFGHYMIDSLDHPRVRALFGEI